MNPFLGMVFFLLLHSEQDPALIAKFLKEGPIALEGYEKDSSLFEERTVHINEIVERGTKKKFEYLSFKNGKNSLFDAVIYKDIEKSEKDRKIVVGNPRHSFTLAQAFGKDEYVLVDYTKAESSVGEKLGAKIVNSRDYAFNDLFFLNKSVNKHKDRVLKCFYVDKESLAVAVFDSYSDINHKFIDEVTIFCKPDKNWQIQKVIRKNPKSITTEELFYDKSSREFSYPNKVIFIKVYTENSDEVASKSVATISISNKSNLSDKTFTLSHYGLPEPDSESNSLFYLYLTGIFCLLGGSLVVFKFVFKK